MLDRSFRHYARVLIDLNLNDALCHRILVERTGYAFFVDIEYENLLDFCSFCKCTGHYIEICKRKPVENKDIPHKQQPKKTQAYVAKKNKEPEVVNVEDSTSKVRIQDDVNLENKVNEEMSKRKTEIAEASMKTSKVNNRAQSVHQDKTAVEGS